MSNTIPQPVRKRTRVASNTTSDADSANAVEIQEALQERILALKIDYVPIGDVRPPVRQVRKHGRKQLHQLKKSVSSFGVVRPIIVDKDNVIVAGHGVYLAAKALKHDTIPVVRLEHLSPPLMRMYQLMDNQSSALGSNDPDILRIELQELSDLSLKFDLDLELTGFWTSEIDNILLCQPAPPTEGGSDDPDAEPVTRPGDLWIVGNHRVFCGNSLEGSSYDALLAGQLADMIVADGPFNVKVASIGGMGKNKHSEFQFASGEMSSPEFVQFQRTVFAHLIKHSKNGSIHYQFMNWKSSLEILLAGQEEYTELKNILVWNKTNAGMGSFYRSQHELIFVFKNGTEPHFCSFGLGDTGRYRTNVLTYAGCNTFGKSRDQDLADHPTVKPLDCIADLIRDCSRRGEIILDPWGGSGTSLLAAEWTGRHARLIELEGRYVDVALRRARDRFGLVATLASTGQTFGEVAAKRNVVLDGEGSTDD